MSKKSREIKICMDGGLLDVTPQLFEDSVLVPETVVETNIENYLNEYLNVYLNPDIKSKVLIYIGNDTDKAKQIVKYINTIGLSSLKSLQII